MAKISSNMDSLIARLGGVVSKTAPNSPALKDALTRIGLYVTALAKINARSKGIIDTGRLINSLRYEFFTKGTTTGILVGSFNVPYAALHEFGGPFTPQMRRAMFAAMAKRGRKPNKSKKVVIGDRFRARPYLRPAITKSRGFMLDTLRAALAYSKG